MGINGIGSYYAQNYAVQNRSRSAGRKLFFSKDESIGNATSLSESSNNGKKIGITTVGDRGYIAMYADSSTEQDPIVKVGDYEVRVKDVNPNNATKMEMFALMSYMDDKGFTNNQGMKSFNKMTAYASQAEYNGYCSGLSDESAAWTEKRDWIAILENAKESFFNIPQTYEQGLECEKIIENLRKYTGSSFKEYETANYKVVPCNDGAYSCFNIYKNGESAGAYFYSDICIKRDSITGTEVLLSEHGTGAGMYNVIPMDEELKQALKGAMGVDELPTEELSGYSIKTHPGTGIQYVMKNGAEGRGGTPLLRSQRDVEKYNELTQTYMDKYPNLVTSQGMAEMYASFEICGCMHRTETGIMKVFQGSISYNDNNDYKKNWAAKFDDATWDLLYEWLEEHQNRVNDFDKFQSWADILDEIGGTYERIWSDEELDQGYLNN